MTTAILLAAGSSSRFAATCPSAWPGERRKVHVHLEPSLPLWKVSFKTFRTHPRVDMVGIVCAPGEEHEFDDSDLDFVVRGGETRQQSSINGILAAKGADIVLIHDTARPGATPDLITRVIDATEEFGAAIPALPVVDTLKRATNYVESTIDRAGIFAAQTPQGSRKDWLLDALSQHAHVTDEASALEAAGRKVRVVEGDRFNHKITSFEDFQLMMDQQYSNEILSGIGYDIHRFSSKVGRVLVLGGVRFDGEPGLAGHSDADVVLHAVTDALLGAVSAGDIGQLFPDTDPAWKDADSRHFVREAVRRVSEAGGRVTSLDITILAESPKIGPRREQMREQIAQETGVDVSKINVKATTHEGLGAIGRGEGIAAIAIATVSSRIRRTWEV